MVTGIQSKITLLQWIDLEKLNEIRLTMKRINKYFVDDYRLQ